MPRPLGPAGRPPPGRVRHAGPCGRRGSRVRPGCRRARPSPTRRSPARTDRARVRAPGTGCPGFPVEASRANRSTSVVTSSDSRSTRPRGRRASPDAIDAQGTPGIGGGRVDRRRRHRPIGPEGQGPLGVASPPPDAGPDTPQGRGRRAGRRVRRTRDSVDRPEHGDFDVGALHGGERSRPAWLGTDRWPGPCPRSWSSTFVRCLVPLRAF